MFNSSSAEKLPQNTMSAKRAGKNAFSPE